MPKIQHNKLFDLSKIIKTTAQVEFQKILLTFFARQNNGSMLEMLKAFIICLNWNVGCIFL